MRSLRHTLSFSALAFPACALPPLSRLALLALGTGVFLSGCGFLRHEPREAWRAAAEAACMRSGIVPQSAYIRPAQPIDGPGPCGTDMPLKVGAFPNDAEGIALAYAGTSQAAIRQRVVNLTLLKPESTMGCPMVAWTDDWILGSVQPAALAWFGQGIKELRSGGGYACRRRNHQANAKLSEHAFGNALDIMAFVLNDGTVITVKGGWKGTPQEQGFLRDTLHGGCQRFKTALGPGADAFHYDHFHFDLARHDSAGKRRYCKPFVEAPQRPAPGTFMPPVNPYGGPQGLAYAPQLPKPAGSIFGANPRMPAQAGEANTPARALEQEEEFDPKAFDLTGAAADLPRMRTNRSRLPGQAIPAAPVGVAPPRDGARQDQPAQDESAQDGSAHEDAAMLGQPLLGQSSQGLPSQGPSTASALASPGDLPQPERKPSAAPRPASNAFWGLFSWNTTPPTRARKPAQSATHALPDHPR